MNVSLIAIADDSTETPEPIFVHTEGCSAQILASDHCICWETGDEDITETIEAAIEVVNEAAELYEAFPDDRDETSEGILAWVTWSKAYAAFEDVLNITPRHGLIAKHLIADQIRLEEEFPEHFA